MDPVMEESMNVQILTMRPEHYEGKARVHCLSWRETYRGLMPEEVLAKRTEAYCLERTRQHPEHTLVAIVEGEVAGFLWYSPEARAYTGRSGYSEINAFYILKKYQRCGIGRALLVA